MFDSNFTTIMKNRNNLINNLEKGNLNKPLNRPALGGSTPILVGSAMAGLMMTGCANPQPEQPNVLFILVDDMQSDAIAALGNPDVQSPNIDGLINNGVSFNNNYTNGALCGALSMPSRAMIMTGRGVFDIQSDGMKIPTCHETFPELFREHGYRTFGTGKWHADFASYSRSFSEGENIFFGGMHPYELNGHCSPHLHHYDSTGQFKDTKFIGDDFSSRMFANAAIDFLESTKDNDSPFLAYVAFSSPHDPRNQLPDYGQKYEGSQVHLPENFLPEHPFDNGDMQVRDEKILPTPRKGSDMKDELALYYGMVSEVDYQIGRVLEALEKTGKRDNTIIVFASDNGLAMGQNGLIGKQNLYEHSVSVPLVIIDPRVNTSLKSTSKVNSEVDSKSSVGKGVRTDAYSYLYDIYPTLCDMAGLEIPETVKGKSLKGIVYGTADKVRDDVFLSYSNIQRAIVKDDYKYIIYHVKGKLTEQLFDLKNDPGELHNLLNPEVAAEFGNLNLKDILAKNVESKDLNSSQSYRKIADEYKELLKKRMKENNDFCDLDKKHWWKDGHMITWDELTHLYIFD